MTGYVDTVNVVHRLRPGYYARTAIDKRPLTSAVRVGPLGLAGDRQMASSHGGPDKAVYAYAREDADYWAAELGRDVPPGLFGENLSLVGVDVSGALLGERWMVGDVVLEVRMPRTPCPNLSLRVGVEDFHIRFNATGRVGALLRVVEPGMLEAGAAVTVVERPSHMTTVRAWAIGASPEQAERLLACGVPLAASVRAKAHRLVDRAQKATR